MLKVVENGADREVWGELFELDAIAQAGARADADGGLGNRSR
jgi:hypothetical protein